MIPQTQVIRLNIRGTPIETTLDTLLADPGSVLCLMFEPMVQGAEPVNTAAARSGVGALMEAVPHQYGGRPGPAACRAKRASTSSTATRSASRPSSTTSASSAASRTPPPA